jgi:hypothetical protein
MQLLNLIFATMLFVSASVSSGAQSQSSNIFSPLIFTTHTPAETFNDCAAILYNDRVLVDSYSPEGKCKLEMGMKGLISVAAVHLTGCQQVGQKIDFRVAIKNDRTNTLWMYSEETFSELLLEDVLKKCERGDRIIIMTVDQKYSLPHHEIELVWGC